MQHCDVAEHVPPGPTHPELEPEEPPPESGGGPPEPDPLVSGELPESWGTPPLELDPDELPEAAPVSPAPPSWELLGVGSLEMQAPAPHAKVRASRARDET